MTTIHKALEQALRAQEDLIGALFLDRIDVEDWPDDSREALGKVKAALTEGRKALTQSSNPSGKHSEPSSLDNEPAPGPMTDEEHAIWIERCEKAWAGVNPQDLRDGSEPAPSMAVEQAPKANMFHDAGAMAQCQECKRYTLDGNAIGSSDSRQPVCTCGQQHYWSGSFKPPGPDAQWHGPAPAALLQSPALPDPQLCKFYEVETYPDLVANMARHIEKLQAKLPPTRDEQPGKARFA